MAGEGDLARALRSAIRGEVRFDAGARAAYSTDASNYRQVPIGVVLPRDADDVVAALAVCREHDVPVLPRGGGTSTAGQCCNVAVVLDCSRHLDAIVELDPGRRTARVQPGVVLDRLREAARPHGLSFGPDPATHAWCTVGGMIGNNACGVHSLLAGRTADNVEALEVVTYRGERLRLGPGGAGLPAEQRDRLLALRDRVAELVRARYPRIPRRVSGYNLDELLPERGFDVPRALVGTEGTCVTVLEATVLLVPWPAARTLVVLGYEHVDRAAEAVPEVLAQEPIGLEGFDHLLVEGMRRKGLHTDGIGLLPEGRGWLLVDVGADTQAEAGERARSLVASLSGDAAPLSACVFDDPAAQAGVWLIRESALGAVSRLPGEADRWEGWEDSAVAPERLGGYLRELRRLLDRHGYRAVLYGHFGEGCLHNRIDFDLASAEGIARYRRFVEEAADLVVSYGGSLSGEHGDGQARAELLPRMFGEELVEAFREFKSSWDPDGRMNPGKVVDPAPLDEHLRLGPGYEPAGPRTQLAFVDDDGSFARAALRCVGVGKCRKTEAGAMCPSYMATRDELHSTRGRARLLFELLEGDPIRGGWRDEHVREALDLCLACKACKSECPAGVDLATYKAEFLSHYYRRRPRPLHLYAVGLVDRWVRLAALAPGLANRLIPRLGPLLGFAPERRLPPFAQESFRAWFARRPARAEGERVILWPDTFTNAFAPGRGRAAALVLEAAGFRVELPRAAFCCGRPLYDAGMLATARRRLRRAVEVLRDDVRAGATVVGLEPSCIAVFRDELRNVLPRDEDAALVARRVVSLAELLADRTLPAPARRARVLLHGHCHQRALWGLTPERSLLASLGVEVEEPDSGCCGMAGGFGLQRDHYEVSIACGERVLLPAVRAAGDALVVADGFSCCEQVEQATGRRPLHLAEALAELLAPA